MEYFKQTPALLIGDLQDCTLGLYFQFLSFSYKSYNILSYFKK